MNSNGPVARKASEQGAFQRIVMHAFGLRPNWRGVFLLCDIQGFTIAESAAILGVSPATVTSRLDLARREMNARLRVGQQDRTQVLP
jgi:DNA-directed RNA polymerase specialized sigma24 family protein